MSDISMCQGTNCPIKESCHRFTAKPNDYYQSYFSVAPYDHRLKDCLYYWANKTA